MDKKYLVGNWKMHHTLQEAIAFMAHLLPQLDLCTLDHLEVAIAPAFVHLLPLKQLIGKRSYLQLLAQNCHHETSGAFTGEVSAAMLASAEVSSVLVAHSERIGYTNEQPQMVAKKIQQILHAGMAPLLCCGENIEVRESGKHKTTIQQQLEERLAGLIPEQVGNLRIAYEPIWAIGTGKVADLEIITEMHAFIKDCLNKQFGAAGSHVPILYGGSCNSTNVSAILNCPNVSGALIGAASLQVASFMEIITKVLDPLPKSHINR